MWRRGIGSPSACSEAGLSPVIDGIGNVIGRSPVDAPRLLIGSHSESQNHAGWLDGALGVVYGLEVARAVHDDPDCAGLAVDVVSFADEEGHYGAFIGSRSLCGLLDDAEIDRLANRFDGTSLRAALEALASRAGRGSRSARSLQGLSRSPYRAGRLPRKLGSQARHRHQHRGHLAVPHPFRGRAEPCRHHPHGDRKDAGLALVRLAAAIDRRFPEVAGERTVWTTGQITLEPGAPSIIPGRAEMLFQFRDADPDRLALLERTLEQLVEAADAAGPCRCRLDVVSRSVPKLMDPRFQDALEEAAQRHAPGAYTRMPSAAGHDAQILARRCPPACCSCRASAASAIIGGRIPGRRTSCSAARSWRRRRSRSCAADPVVGACGRSPRPGGLPDQSVRTRQSPRGRAAHSRHDPPPSPSGRLVSRCATGVVDRRPYETGSCRPPCAVSSTADHDA